MGKIVGIVLLIVAVYIGYMGYTESQGVVSSVTSVFSGKPTDNVMLKYIAALVSGVIGLYFLKK